MKIKTVSVLLLYGITTLFSIGPVQSSSNLTPVHSSPPSTLSFLVVKRKPDGDANASGGGGSRRIKARRRKIPKILSQDEPNRVVSGENVHVLSEENAQELSQLTTDLQRKGKVVRKGLGRAVNRQILTKLCSIGLIPCEDSSINLNGLQPSKDLDIEKVPTKEFRLNSMQTLFHQDSMPNQEMQVPPPLRQSKQVILPTFVNPIPMPSFNNVIRDTTEEAYGQHLYSLPPPKPNMGYSRVVGHTGFPKVMAHTGFVGSFGPPQREKEGQLNPDPDPHIQRSVFPHPTFHFEQQQQQQQHIHSTLSPLYPTAQSHIPVFPTPSPSPNPGFTVSNAPLQSQPSNKLHVVQRPGTAVAKALKNSTLSPIVVVHVHHHLHYKPPKGGESGAQTQDSGVTSSVVSTSVVPVTEETFQYATSPVTPTPLVRTKSKQTPTPPTNAWHKPSWSSVAAESTRFSGNHNVNLDPLLFEAASDWVEGKNGRHYHYGHDDDGENVGDGRRVPPRSNKIHFNSFRYPTQSHHQHHHHHPHHHHPGEFQQYGDDSEFAFQSASHAYSQFRRPRHGRNHATFNPSPLDRTPQQMYSSPFYEIK